MTEIPVSKLINRTASPAIPLELSPYNVHVWLANIRTLQPLLRNFELSLASNERERATRFQTERLRDSFVIRRGALRLLLAQYVRVHPARISIQYGPTGKPCINSSAGIEFNTTHSGDLAAFAFALGCPVGIDLEQIRRLPEINKIQNGFFCPDEAAELACLPDTEREHAFFACWTRKEAYLKSTGDGLTVPMNSFRVSIAPHQPARLLHISGDAHAAKFWSLHDLALAPAYASALAYKDRQRALSICNIVLPPA